MTTAKQLNEERAAIERKRREREEQHLYLPVGVVTEDNFKAHQGFDLVNWDADPSSESAPQAHRILRTSTVSDFTKSLAESKNLTPEQVRLWVMVNRQNKTTRPDQPLVDPNMTIDEAYNKYGSRDKSFRLWLETTGNVEDGKPVWPDMQPQTSNNVPMLVFLKYFDAISQSLLGVGHIYVRKHSKVGEMIPMIQQLMGWSPGSSSNQSAGRSSSVSSGNSSGHSSNQSQSLTLALYEVCLSIRIAYSLVELLISGQEIKHSMIEPMKPKVTLQQAEIQDGDIVCFQRVLPEKEYVDTCISASFVMSLTFC